MSGGGEGKSGSGSGLKTAGGGGMDRGGGGHSFPNRYIPRQRPGRGDGSRGRGRWDTRRDNQGRDGDRGRGDGSRGRGGFNRGRFYGRGRGNQENTSVNTRDAERVDAAADHNARGKRAANVADQPQDEKKQREDLCCEVCEGEHKTPDCPLYNGPKPHAIFCGFAGSKLGFFQIPMEAPPGKAPKRESASALISAKDGVLTADLIKAELARLIPVRFEWTVQTHGKGFLLPFPCKVELQRMVATRYIHTQNGEGIMEVEEWDEKIEPQELLKKGWVNIYGVPYEIRSFLPLWAIGTVLGATLKVDMKYTRRMDVCRVLVGVTDLDDIPDATDIVVGEGVYEFFFQD
jgi:hypothetical protein